MRGLKVVTVMASALVALVSVTAQAGDDIRAEQVWTNQTLGSVKTGAIYLTLHNESKHDEELIAASTPVAERVELHDHKMDGDIMRMERQDSVAVPAGESVTFKPGGLHIMLFGVSKPIHEGDEVPVTLNFASGAKVEAVATAKSMKERMQQHSGHGDHGSHDGHDEHDDHEAHEHHHHHDH